MNNPRILVAADKFKGSLDGPTANAAIARGLKAALPRAEIRVRTVADGGDGTLAVLLGNGFGAVAVEAAGPTLLPRRCRIGRRGPEAFVELAEVCGLAHLPDQRLQGLRAGTWGLGLAVRAALDLGVRRIHLALGGSASTDGGLGLLAALGAVATDADGQWVTNDATGLMRVAHLDLSGLDHRLRSVGIAALTDVRNPLSGPQGAAHVYGPQKGLTPEQVPAVDAALRTWADLLRTAGREDFDPDAPGTGAAGGVGAAVVGGLGGSLTPGAPFVLDAIGFDAALPGTRMVVTGEGSWDEQSRNGKAPGEVLRRAHESGIPTAIIAGRVTTRDGLAGLGVRSVTALVDRAGNETVAMRDAERLLEEAGTRLGRAWRW